MAFKLKFGIPKQPAPKKVSDRWPAEIAQQSRRITGVTPRVLRSYTEAPARWIPRSRGLLKGLAGGKKMGKSGVGI